MSNEVEALTLHTAILEKELRRRQFLRLVYVAVGFSALVAGFALALLGYSGAVDFELGIGDIFRARLGNAAPGLVFAVCGLAIVVTGAFAFSINTTMQSSPTSAGGTGVQKPEFTFVSSYAMQMPSASPFTIRDPVTLGQIFNVYNHLRSARSGEIAEDDIDWLPLNAALVAIAAVKGERPPPPPEDKPE